jgi:hypothetical protein
VAASQDGADVTGSIGPAAGFEMPGGYDEEIALRIRFNLPGAHQLRVTLEDGTQQPALTRATLQQDFTVWQRYFFPLVGR